MGFSSAMVKIYPGGIGKIKVSRCYLGKSPYRDFKTYKQKKQD